MRRKADAGNDLQEIWLSALRSSHGLAISTDDRRLLKQQLYATRKAMDDPRLEKFSIHTPETEGELWIVNREAADVQFRG